MARRWYRLRDMPEAANEGDADSMELLNTRLDEELRYAGWESIMVVAGCSTDKSMPAIEDAQPSRTVRDAIAKAITRWHRDSGRRSVPSSQADEEQTR